MSEVRMNTNCADESPRIISREEVERIIARVMSYVDNSQQGTVVTVQSWWDGELRWARNRVSLASDRRDILVSVNRSLEGAVGSADTNQLDDVSLEAVVRAAERSAEVMHRRETVTMPIQPPQIATPSPTIWSDATYNITAEERGRVARLLTEGAEAKDLLSAGYLEMRAGEVASLNTQSATPGTVRYDTFSQAQCSMTVRHPNGVGSGWAGLSSYDWSAIDSNALSEIALEKCIKSLNPVAIEPGRYTVILEPQAVADLLEVLIMWLNRRTSAEEGYGPFPLGIDKSLRIIRTKLGLKVVDERLSISHDPMDPLLGVVPTEGLAPITWIEHGILRSLSYGRDYALGMLNENLPSSYRPSYRMSGGDVSIDEMIKTTKRGLLVTRFSGLLTVDVNSVLLSGLTRDGLWLIENGSISKAVKNMRFTESPMFVLNQVDQLGVPVPVFRPIANPYSAALSPAIVPALKVNDFSFTSTVDAI